MEVQRTQESASDGDTGTTPVFVKGYRRKRISFTTEQLDILEQNFRLNKYPGITIREELSRELGICESRVQVWFQNRRSKWRKYEGGHRQRTGPMNLNEAAYVCSYATAANHSWPMPTTSRYPFKPFAKCASNGRAFRSAMAPSISGYVEGSVPTSCTSSFQPHDEATTAAVDLRPTALVACVSSILNPWIHPSLAQYSTNDCLRLKVSNAETAVSRHHTADEILAAKGLISVKGM